MSLKVGSKILREYNLDVTCIDSGFECINKIENNPNRDKDKHANHRNKSNLKLAHNLIVLSFISTITLHPEAPF